MLSTRRLLPAVAALLLATPAFAQMQSGSTGGATSGSTTNPSSPPPLVGGAAQPSGASMAGRTPMGAGGAGGAFRPITPMAGGNIVAELRASGEFTILLKALDATNLTSVVSGQPNITLLAPTDAAFSALPPAQVTSLMAPENAAKLQALLTYHLINARVSLDKVQNHAAGPVVTVAQKPVTIDGTGATIKVNDANVVQAAIPASNGLIYVVDKVLTPAS